MANVKISDLTAASAAADANELEINEAGTSKKLTVAQVSSKVISDIVTADITALGALMDSELTSLADVKAINQALTTTSGPTFTTIKATSISFDAGTNVLDYHEKGTWTPALSDGTNSDATASTLVANYERTGDVCVVQTNYKTSSIGSVSGAIRINGLPFASLTTSASRGGFFVGSASGLNITSGQVVSGFVGPNATHITLTLWDTAGGTSTMQSGEWSSNGGVQPIAGSYIVA